jgi:hypothetical protein
MIIVYLGFLYLGTVVCCCIKEITTDEVVTELNLKLMDECVICLEDSDIDIIRLKCSHRFHKKCIEQWILQKKECPICSYIIHQ